MTSRKPAEASRANGRIASGIALALATAAISGVSVFVNAFAVKQVPDPAVFTTLKNGVAGLLLIGLAATVVRPAQVRALDRRAWAGMGVIAVVGGSVPFLLFFTGLAQASAPSAAFIHKTLFVWVAMLAVPFLGERLGWLQVAALGALVAGQLLVTPPSGVQWGVGETMIAAATLLWAVEVVIAKRVLATVPASVVGAARLSLGLVVLIGFLVATGRFETFAALTGIQWAWGIGTGALLAGYVATWYAALQRAPATVVSSVLVLGAPITAVLTLASSGTAPTASAIGGHVLIAAGVVGLAAVSRAGLRVRSLSWAR